MGVDLQMPAAFKALQRNLPSNYTKYDEPGAKTPDKEQELAESIADLSLRQNEFDFGESEPSGPPSMVSTLPNNTANSPVSSTDPPNGVSKEGGCPSNPASTNSSGTALGELANPGTPRGGAKTQNAQAITTEAKRPDFGDVLPPSETARLRFVSVMNASKRTNIETTSIGTHSNKASSYGGQSSSTVQSTTQSSHTAQSSYTAQSSSSESTLNTQKRPDHRQLSATPSMVTFSAGVDRYGFKKPTNAAAGLTEWAEKYNEYIQYREQKWIALLKSNGLSAESENGGPPVRFPPESQKLKRYVRKGIPPKWRGNAWFWFARGNEKLNSHPGLYDKLVVDTATLKNNDTEHIERDLHRTFPDNVHFQNNPITNDESDHLKALRRVLTTFSAYQPKIGYCQSLNFIAGNLLLVLPEEKAFWMLVIITQNYLIGLHDINLEQVNISQGILMISVRDRLPKIWKAMNLDQSLEENFISNLPPISLCTAPWFMSLMVNVLPTETMMRIWDCFFLEGPKTLFRISLAIFKYMEPRLQTANDELEVFQLIQSAPRGLYDPEVLIRTCFRKNNGFGHISNEDIRLLRAFVNSRRQAFQEGLVQETSDRNAYAKLHRGRRVKSRLRIYR